MVDIEAVKHSNPIAEVVSRHGVQLRGRGERLTGRCPFHADSQPSFTVYPATRSFYCFGCGAGGDVIDFVRRAEGLDFREALLRLDDASTEAPRQPRPQRAIPTRLSLDDRIILAAAFELYYETLAHTPAALRYLHDRGVPEGIARRCRLGYADGRQLVQYLSRRRLSLRRAREIGLLTADGREALAGRIVVPELRGGRCTWLVGRALDYVQQPKYRGLALPRPLLGWELVRDRSRVFVTEGPFDWLTLVGWGLPACALLGTQAGQGTLRLLDRARSIVLVLDSDAPGVEAASSLAAALGERASVLRLPDRVKDVNELGVRANGRATFFESVDAIARSKHDAAQAS